MNFKPDKWNVIIFVCTLSFLPILVSASLDKSPKIITKEGNVFLEAGMNKNITIRLNGHSRLIVNDMDLVSLLLGGPTWISNSSSDMPNNGVSFRVLQEDLSIIKRRIFGRSGLSARLNRLVNRTSTANPMNVLRRTQRRVRILETRVQNIVRKLKMDNCKSNPCDNGGTCIDLYDGFLCKCRKGFEGPKCSTDVNECALFFGSDLGCQNGGQCINQFGGYSCICTQGWQGMHCSQRSADCLHSSNAELCGHGTCVNSNDNFGYRCICESGWKTNGLTPACSVDVDECKEYSNTCSTKCVNLPGSYTCAPCEPGYTGNGLSCRDIDECATDNGGCSIAPYVHCINSYGSFHCGECPIGWQGDGRVCTRDSGSSCIKNNICHPMAVCSEVANTIVCSCPIGQIGNGVGPNGCRSSGTSMCTINPCLNGGSCMDTGNDFRCLCLQGFKPPLCTPISNPCATNPCRNGGSCQANGTGGFSCACVFGYGGRLCDSQRSRCGQSINAVQGNLKYPLNDLYHHNSQCSWVIRTNATKVLNITFTKFEVEDSSECRFDWLQIHDGPTAASQLIGRFCGTKAPRGGNIITTTDKIFLWFKSDNSTAKAGFDLWWTSIDPVCGGITELDSHTTIASPGSPGNYPRNRDCRWHLKAPNNKRIKLVFFSLQIENHADCNHDYLEVTDAVSNSRLEIFCNSSNPIPFIVPSNEIIVHFHSDNEGSDVGFQIHAETVERIPGCGGTYTERIGQIYSPSGFEGSMSCEYTVKYAIGLRVQLDVTEFKMGDEDCIEIFDVKAGEKASTGRWCGKMHVPTFKSTGNEVQINYYSKGGTFKIAYGTICEYTFEDPVGTITSPNYPKLYPSDELCTYEIIGEAHQVVALEFEDMDLESSEGVNTCWFDYITITDGNNETAGGPYCGKTIPPKIVTSTSLLKLMLRTDSTNAGRGFKGHYALINTDNNCGGILRKPSGQIKLPSDPTLGTYKNDLSCTWTIIAPAGFGIQITWESFKLEESSDCLYDYLEIFDTNQLTPETAASHKFCGTTLPPALVSATSLMTLKFTSDSTDSEDGFVAKYRFVDVSTLCGGTFFSSTGELKSPNFPNEYPTDVNCSWAISVQPGHQIELKFDAFDLEKTVNCTDDWLEIRNGGSPTSPLIGTYCGKDIPNRIPSFTHQIHINFKSDSKIVKSGFRLQWETASLGCGGILTSDHGSIASPFYPQYYSSDAQCEWRISVNKGSTISLTFEDLALEGLLSCSFDFVDIYDGSSTERKKIGRYCQEETPIHIETTGSNALIRFQTDSSNTDRGFYLSYRSNCNQILNATHGAIESPNFRDNNPRNMNCTWTIKAPKGNRVSLDFVIVGKKDTFTKSDFIYIFDTKGNVTRITETKRIEIQSDTVKIQLNSTSIYFSMEYAMKGCIGTYHRPSGEFTSPGYPNPYPDNIGCRWDIETEIGKAIQVVFTSMDIERTVNCTTDHIEVWNTAQMSHAIGRFCGNQNNVTITSTGHSLFVLFTSDRVINGKGFVAKYTTVESKCGGKIALPHGSIHSPNYPHNYDSNLHCEWLIEVSDHSTMTLTIEELDLEDSYQCALDSLKIFQGSTADEFNPWVNLCGDQLPTKINYQTTSNTALVIFDTDGDTEYKGFKVSFKENCGKSIIVNDTGRIRFSGSDQKECSWKLSAEDLSKHVTLTTTLVHVRSEVPSRNHSECDGVMIYDGVVTNTTTANFKTKFCNKHPPALTSFGSALTVNINPQYIAEFEGFYSVMDNNCGGNFSSMHGTFASPLYPHAYPLDVECIWEIKATEGNWLVLTIQAMNLEKSEGCNSDYLEVREGGSDGRLIEVLCGDDIPNPLMAKKSFWIKFKSDDDNVQRGFLAEYSYSPENEINGTGGVIESPQFPMMFNSIMMPHTWRISVPRGNLIMLTVEYNLRHFFNNVRFFNGYNDQAERIEYTDATIVKSDTNFLFIKSYAGAFRFRWFRVSKEFMESNQTTLRDSSNCSQIINLGQVHITIQSPGYPNGYDSNLNCNWTFVPVNDASHAVISFQRIDLEDQADCLADSIDVYSSTDLINWKHLQKTCKLKTDAVLLISAEKFLRVQFTSDYGVNRTGFTAVAHSTCGSVFNEPTGLVNSSSYRHFMNSFQSECVWQIKVKTGRRIKLTFLESVLKTSTDTNAPCMAYVLLKNGISEHSPNLGSGKYCDTVPDIPVTSSNEAYVKLKFDRFTVDLIKVAFKYEEVMNECIHTIDLTENQSSVTVKSENYPNIPHPHTMCVWIIRAPIHRLIAIDFVHPLNLKEADMCDAEYVELHDGATDLSPLIGRFCGKSSPNAQFSSGNNMRITFLTDIAEPSTGFMVNASLRICGGIYRQVNGTISTPKAQIPWTANGNFSCDYLISIDDSNSLNVTLLSTKLPWTTNCSEVNHLRITPIYNIEDKPEEPIIICGDTLTKSYIFDTNNVRISYQMVSRDVSPDAFAIEYQSLGHRCGQTIEAESGILQSPGYSFLLQVPMRCKWKIKVPKGRRIKIEFLEYRMGVDATNVSRSNFRFPGWLSFFNDLNGHSNIARVSNRSPIPQVLYSTDNIMSVVSIEIPSTRKEGFKLRFSSDEESLYCNGNFDSPRGDIIFRPPSNTTVFCSYDIDVAPKQTLVLTVNVIMVNTALFREFFNCMRNSPITLQEDMSEANFYWFCGNRNETTVRVPNPITFDMSSTIFNNMTLLDMKYARHNCGGVFTIQNQFQLNQPSISTRNYGSLDCAWKVLPNEGDIDQFEVTISIDFKLKCDEEYLIVRSNSLASSPHLGRFCNQATVSNLVAMKTLFVEYHTSTYSNTSTFNLTATPGTGCGGELSYPFRLIDFRKQYQNNVECIWTIQVKKEFHVGLRFSGRFFIESSTNCTKDYLLVQEKVGDDWNDVKRICGREAPAFVNSTTSVMRLIFRSDDNGLGDGFTANFDRNCGGVFKASKALQYLESPNYPSNYESNLFCNYTILPSESDKSFVMQINDFMLETAPTNGCEYDNLTIYVVNDDPVVLCGSKEKREFRSTEPISMVFQTDSSFNRKGFQIEFGDQVCGGNVTSSRMITSPKQGANKDYPPSAVCIWNITAPADSKIVVKFEQFEFEGSYACSYDYVELFAGKIFTDEQRLAKLCGNLTGSLPHFSTKSNMALIRSVADQSEPSIGFSALITFTKNCDQIIKLQNLNELYTFDTFSRGIDNNLNCEIVFETTVPGRQIVLEFNNFHVEDSPKCDRDYVKIRDGGGPFADEIGTFCGHTIPNPVMSSRKSLFLNVVSDSSDSSTGFTATVKAIPMACGSHELFIRPNESVVIESGEGGKYLPNLNCFWRIRSDRNIRLNFEKLDIQDPDTNGSCTTDYLKIFNKEYSVIESTLGSDVIFNGRNGQPISGSYEDLEHVFCGNKAPEGYYTNNNEVFVKFFTDSSIQKSGFKIVASSANDCFKNYTATQGRILMETSADCVLYINAPQNYSITLYFYYFYLYYGSSSECDNDFIEVFDQSVKPEKSLRKICGSIDPANSLFSNSNKLRVNLAHSGGYNNYDITFLASDKGPGCGGDLYNYAGVITSPMYPENTRNNSDCQWNIRVPNNLVVSLDFKTFDLGSKVTCHSDYLEILENRPNRRGSSQVEVMRRYCGEDTVTTYTGRQNTLSIRFRKSVNFDGTGWVIRFAGIHQRFIIV